MSDTILMLQIEHANARRVLSVLEEELRAQEAGASWDSLMLKNAFEYFSGYPAQCHHPIEDMVYRFLRERNPEATRRLGDLDAEHERLSKVTASIHSLINAPGALKRNQELRAKLRQFIDTYHTHMQIEERHFFPAALSNLTASDWESMDFTLFDRPDPLFNREKEGQFEALRERILALGHQRRQERESEREAEWLARIQSVTEFNAACQDHGWPLKLCSKENSGFEIAVEDDVLARVPECDEQVAAWCAYYYFKGLYGVKAYS